jgi:HAD superfamily hydrolase (TIGR01490 family)
MGKTAAFFDFDETLLAIDSAGIGFRLLREEGYLTRSFLAKMVVVLLAFKLGLINEHTMAKSMLQFYKGRELQPFVDSAPVFFREYLEPNFSEPVLERLRWHQQQGHVTVLISGSIDYYLQPVMDKQNLDHLLCTHLQVDDQGLLTGQTEGPVCVADTKVDLAKSLAVQEGLDLSASFAYGNSRLDIPLLALVGHPVTVNPDRRLTRYARRQHWPDLTDLVLEKA